MQVPFLNLEYIYNWIYQVIAGDHSGLISFLKTAGLIIWILAALAVPFLLFGIVYFSRRLSALRKEQAPALAETEAPVAEPEPVTNPRWEKIAAGFSSANEADWKLAVIEADALLDELIRNIYPHLGDNLGERLKNIEPSDFTSLQDAWNAHKIRNQIAHDHNYRLNERDARLALDSYKKVFEEFHFI